MEIFAFSLLIIVTMAHAFTMRKPLADRMYVICGFICILLSIACLAYVFHGQRVAYTVFGVVTFIWIAVCIATSYAFSKVMRQLCTCSCNENAKSLPALIGALAVTILGIVACVCLMQWIFT